jgi:hypothetical protein
MDNTRHLNNAAHFLDTRVDPAAVYGAVQNEQVQHDLGIALAWAFDAWELAIVRNTQH